MQGYLLRNTENPESADIKVYQRAGGYRSLQKALSMKPKEIIDEVKRSGLRGRGGAFFPTWIKWSMAASDPKTPRYLVCNADEGEPGTFKDRTILERNPHLLIEGMIISGHALSAELGFVYLRYEYPKAYDIFDRAVQQAYEKGYLGEDILGSGKTFNIIIHQGAGGYICGEETALLDSLEGKRGQPRIKPPYPASEGYLKKPTIVNNVETLANIPLIAEIGSDAYSRIGSPECTGPKLFSVSGHVEKPGLYELPMGTTLRKIIFEHAGGVIGGRALKAVIPGGVSAPVLTPKSLDCQMDAVSLQKCGSMLGSGAVIVLADTACTVKVALRITRFFERESCGKCTPCREGISWMVNVLDRIENGRGNYDDMALLRDISNNISGKTFCPLGTSAAIVVKKFMDNFRDEFETHITDRGCALIGSMVRE